MEGSNTKWPLKLYLQKDEFTFRVFVMHKGWTSFVVEAKIEVGDLLIFDLLKYSHFRVHVFHEEAAEENSAAEDSDANQFVVMVVPPNSMLEKSKGAKSIMDIPDGFWNRHGHMLSGEAIYLEGPNNINMKLKYLKISGKGPRVRLEARTWAKFSKANNFRLGETLVFTLAGPSQFKVKRVDEICNTYPNRSRS